MLCLLAFIAKRTVKFYPVTLVKDVIYDYFQTMGIWIRAIKILMTNTSLSSTGSALGEIVQVADKSQSIP